MDLTHILRFLAVVDEGSFAAAAKRCLVTPQAIAFSISKMESELGVKLFDREPGGITQITEYASALEDHGRGLIIAERRAFEAVQALRDARSGWIRLGVGETMTGAIVAKVIADIKAERPDVEVLLMEDYTDILIKRLRLGEIDLIAGAPVTALQDIDILVQDVLFETCDLIVARREHPLAGKARVTLEDMSNYTWMVPNVRRDAHSTILRAYVENGLSPPTSFIFSDAMTVGLALMRMQDYLLFSPPDLVTVGDGNPLVKINAPQPTMRRVACLIYRSDLPMSETVMLARERILAAVGSSGRAAKRRTRGDSRQRQFPSEAAESL